LVVARTTGQNAALTRDARLAVERGILIDDDMVTNDSDEVSPGEICAAVAGFAHEASFSSTTRHVAPS